MSDERETCPDCGRYKARNADDAKYGDCPKRWAIRDDSAAFDCMRVGAEIARLRAEIEKLRDLERRNCHAPPEFDDVPGDYLRVALGDAALQCKYAAHFLGEAPAHDPKDRQAATADTETAAREHDDEVRAQAFEEAADLHPNINPASDEERLRGSPGAGAMGAVIEYRDALREKARKP